MNGFEPPPEADEGENPGVIARQSLAEQVPNNLTALAAVFCFGTEGGT